MSTVTVKKLPPAELMRNKMLEFEAAMANMPDTRFGDDAFPLKHTFTDGLYIREMTGIKGHIVVTKLHKTTHPYFVLKGDVSVLTETGVVRIKAPYAGITKAGTKRIAFFHEDTIWTTVHITEETDLKKIEKEMIAETYNELPENVKKTLGIESKKGSEVSLCRG